ncbi:MAG TPA: hypothetical protein DCZ95_16965 [Verrucomicrobia bacterium]|nr:MAG: hypothetical protein A2X46_09455 [Lentisphaerae bacterium GWF2_57_35]HBA85776.1 hypothetical protein [Verrucomicrobiota bacterium]
MRKIALRYLRRAAILCFLPALLEASASAQTIRYISTAGSHLAPYTNWIMAATNFSAAITASVNGDSILVADGVYRLSGTVITLVKGISIQSTNIPGRNVVVDGAGMSRCFNISHANAHLAGMTITNGMTNGIGGGVWVQTAGTISNCTITGNRSLGNNAAGGGVVMKNGGLLVQCRISGNWISGTNAPVGGGVHAENGARLLGCEISDNAAISTLTNAGGGGLSLGTGSSAEGCTSRWNRVAGSGGGILCGSAFTTLQGCLIEGNAASNRGGGVECYQGGEIKDCVVRNNQAGKNGGGVDFFAKGSTSGSLIISNAATRGGGIHFDYGGAATNCTILFNQAALGGGIHCSASNTFNTPRGVLRNCIIVSNTIDNYYFTNVFGQGLDYCITEPESSYFNGTGNSTTAPWFVSSSDYRLAAGSPGIDSGDEGQGTPLREDAAQGLPCDGDFDGFTAYDVGAYEFSTNRDTDVDGLPDGWEYRYWLNPTNGFPAADDDGDSRNNSNEFASISNPRSDLSGTPNWNGLPLGWRIKYFPTNSLDVSSTDDPDGDGLNNFQESIAGTNPTNQYSCFLVAAERIPGSETLRFTWASAPDRSYTFYAGTQLTGTVNFSPLASGLGHTPYPSTNRYEVNMAEGVHFYRIEVMTP